MHRPALRRATAAILALSAASALAAGPMHAQGGTWGTVFTDAARIGAPDWVTPGTRIVWHVASASVAGSRYRYEEDPSGPYVQRSTGKHYRRIEESADEPFGRGSGEGLLAVDVQSVGPDQVVTSASLYVLDRARGGALTYVPIGGGPEPSGALDAVWLHPAILEGLAAAGTGPGMDVYAGPYPLDGVDHDTIVLAAGPQHLTFDRASGLLLVGTSGARETTLQVHLPGEDPATGRSMLTHQRLLGVRQRAMAGTGAPVPDWLRQGASLVYEGSYTLLGSAIPARLTLTAEAVGPDWARFHALHETAAYGITSTNEARAVSGGTGPFWYDPAALAGMQMGDVLDEDPILGTRTRVADAGEWQGGRHVVIVTEGPGMAVWFDHDVATGVAIGYELHQGDAIDSFRLTAMP
jgi:hypothetical protein